MKKSGTVIFGGSFDPITKAHEDIFKNLESRFDRVVVVPSKISPFKLEGSSECAEHRLAMLNLALDSPEICQHEILSDSVSYTYKTVEMLKDSSDIYFALGSEEIAKIDNWKNANYLKENVIFYVVPRPCFNSGDSIARLKEIGYKIEVADFNGLEGSSSQLKIDIAFKKEIGYISSKVMHYISENNLYRNYSFITNRFSEFNISEKRKEHIYRTTLMAVRLAKRYGENISKTIVAALLHDIGKYTTTEDLKMRGIPFKVDITGMTKAVSHAPIGAAIASHVFKVSDEDIINAISSHTTAGINISLLQKIVFAADYVEEGRDFSGVEEIRKICFKDLDVGIETILNATIDYLKQNNKSIYHVSQDSCEFYKKLNQNKLRK